MSLVDSERQWFKARCGLDAAETSRDVSFCAHAICHPGELLEVPDAARDPRFMGNPLVTGDPGIRFYAGMPVLEQGGRALGTLCVIDRVPRELSDRQRQGLTELARHVEVLVELRMANKAFEAELGRRRAIEARLRNRSETLLDFLQSVDNPVLALNRAGWVLFGNRALMERLGRGDENPVGMEMRDIFVDPDCLRLEAVVKLLEKGGGNRSLVMTGKGAKGRQVRLVGNVVVRPTSNSGPLVRLVFPSDESAGSGSGTDDREFACMCSWCSRVQSIRGDWQKLDEYICEHYGVLFSQGICADCSDRVLAGVDFPAPDGSK